MEKLRATRNPFNIDWVSKLPKKRKEQGTEVDLSGFPDLFDTLKIVPPVEQMPLADEVMDTGSAETQKKDPLVIEDDGTNAPGLEEVQGQVLTVAGCDSVEAFVNKCKVRPFKLILKKPQYANILAKLGESLEHNNIKKLINDICKFVCAIYGHPQLHDVSEL